MKWGTLSCVSPILRNRTAWALISSSHWPLAWSIPHRQDRWSLYFCGFMMPQSSSEEKKKLTECLVPIPTGERGALARGELGVTSNPGGSPAYAVLATSRNCRILSTAKCASAKQGAADIVTFFKSESKQRSIRFPAIPPKACRLKSLQWKISRVLKFLFQKL